MTETSHGPISKILLEDLGAAFLLLTRIPIPWHKISSEPPNLSRSLWAYPIVGLCVGVIGALALWMATLLGLPPLVCALLAIASMVAITGAFHEDGLADVADGFGGGSTQERKLEIMRDSRIGTYGAVALILSFGLRSGSLAAISLPQAAAALIAASVLARTLIVVALFVLPPARKESLATVAGRPTPGHLLVALAIATGLLFVLIGSGTGLLTIAVAGSFVLILALIAMKQVGGYTGDVLGSIEQSAEIATLLTLAVVWGSA